MPNALSVNDILTFKQIIQNADPTKVLEPKNSIGMANAYADQLILNALPM